jgi:hypothetical protein
LATQTADATHTEAKASASRKRRWEQLNTVLEEEVRKARKVDKSSTPYSSIEWSDIERIVSIHEWVLKPTQIGEAVTTKLFSQLLDCHTVLGLVVSGKETKRLFFIAPILIAVAYLFKDDTESKVLILVEEDVDGRNIETNGHFEFVLQQGNRRVCITQAKKEQM